MGEHLREGTLFVSNRIFSEEFTFGQLTEGKFFRENSTGKGIQGKKCLTVSSSRCGFSRIKSESHTPFQARSFRILERSFPPKSLL